MINFCVYETATGNVVNFVSGTESVHSAYMRNIQSGQDVIRLPDGSKKFWVDVSVTPHEVKPKTPMPYDINQTEIVSDGGDTCSITNLPNPCTVTWPDGEITEETDGSVHFTIDQPGQYRVTLEAIPYITETIDVTATDPN